MAWMRWAFSAFMAAAAFAACGATTADANRVILPGTAVNELLRQCSRGVPPRGQSAWQPRIADINLFEKVLPAALAKAPQARELDVPRVLRSWRRQYVGIVRGGKRFVYGNFFPVHDPGELPTWRSRPVVVCDGGPVFFGVEMEAATGRITHLAFNGPFG